MASEIIGYRAIKPTKKELLKHVRKIQHKRKPNISAWINDAVEEKMQREAVQ